TDFVTYGVFKSDLGSVSTDILFRPDKANTFIYKGSLRAMGFDVGKFTDREDLLGVISLTAEVDGSSRSFNRFNALFDGTVDSLEFNGYTYRDIKMRGNVTENIWDGSVESSTRDLEMGILGRFDFSGEKPEFDFTLNLVDADLHALNLDRDNPDSRLSMLLTANFSGTNIDNIDGEIRLLNSSLRRNGETFDLYDASLRTGQADDIYTIELRSDFVDADINGRYNLRSVAADISTAAIRLVPSLFLREESLYRISENNFDYSVSFKNSDPLNSFFNTGIKLSPGSRIFGKVDPDSLITLFAEGDYFIYNENTLSGFNLNATIRDTAMNIDLSSKNLNLLNRLVLGSFSAKASTANEEFNAGINWNNPGDTRNFGEIAADGSMVRPDNGKPGLRVNINETSFFVRDQKWIIHPSGFRADSNSLSFDNFLVSHNEDFLNIDGVVSENSTDSLKISFNNLKLDALNSVSKKEGDEESNMEFIVGGSIDGRIMFMDVYNSLLFESDILVKEFTTNEHKYGDVRMMSVWNNIDKVAEISMANNLDGENTFGIDGIYNPESRVIDFTTRVNRFPMDILNLVLQSFAKDVRGFATGMVNITGTAGEPIILGSVMAEDASITVDYLKTAFNFSDSVILDRRGFTFRDIAISDERGNNATINGFVAHNTFKDFNIGLRIDAENIMALDTKQKDNVLFYGTAYGSGVVSITGPTNKLTLDVSARTERNTRLFIPLNAGAEISDYSFISFASSDSASKPERIFNLPFNTDNTQSSIELNFDLEVTPDAEVQLVFDSKVGDVMKGRGNGNLNLSLSRDGKFSIFGDYIIEDGDYLFTLGNIFNKKFVVENGGSISWDGDITDASLNIKAIYKLRTSLYDLLQDEAFSQRIPVDCILNMSGKLINPVIGFDIYLPTADEQTRTYVRNAINTEEEMSRQFLYLMVMNSFYPSTSYASAVNTSSTGASAMGVTTTEMLSNQLSNWLSQISNDFDIGFAYRPGNEVSSQEVEVALSTQLLNDRVMINGNVDVGGQGNASSTSNISGDFDVEVKITEKVRFKVFNRSNDNLYYETSPYTQGFGLFFRQDFNRFRDIFKSNRSAIKKEDKPEVTKIP
ncbi:MAG: translocation/assembly module TamB, partial [Bacteroidia bacterium]